MNNKKMINLSSKEYDLNSLFSFDSLKEILLELAKSQIKLENEIKNLHEENKKRDTTILTLQEIINNYKKENEIININDKIEEEKDEEIKDTEENNIGYENKNDINLIGPNSNIIIHKEKISEKEKTNNKKDIYASEEREKDTNENEDIKRIDSNNNKEENDNEKVSPIFVRKITKQIKENRAKIGIIEETIKKEIKNKKEEEKNIRNKYMDNESKMKSINDKINSLILKNNDFEQKIELLQSNSKALDIVSMFKDDGSGTIDATKVMVKALQEKVFKKFELVETRYKKETEENNKTKTSVDNLIPQVEKIIKDLEKINELNNTQKLQKEEFDNYKKNNEEINNEIKSSLSDDINQKIEKLKDEINSDIKNKIISIEDKLKNSNLREQNGNGPEKENFKILDKKIADLRKKTNDIENTLKLYLKKNEDEKIKNEIKQIHSILETKLTKEDLKELYNNRLADLDEINDIKDKCEINEEEINKMNKEIRTAMQKIESFQGNLILLQNISGSSGIKKIVDYSKYVEHQKLNDSLNPFAKQLESIMKEIDSIRRDMNEIENNIKQYSTNSIKKLEEESTNKMNELKIFIQKKYLEKYDFNRIIKTIEVQIKALNDETKKKDADTWLLAKRNSKCFNCATCEANIKNENYTTADYLAWKKYPRGEKIHRMGQGFSHMLEMVSSEFAKSIERNDFQNENNNNILNSENNIYVNTLPEPIERASSTKLKINKKNLIQDENIQNIKTIKNIGKMKLPKMIQSKIKLNRNENNPNGGNLNSDDDNTMELNIIRNSFDKDEIPKIVASPKIMKIFKKTKNDINSNSSDNFKTIQEEKNHVDKDQNF